MSRLGAKTYSRKPECKTSVQFDHLLADKGNKPSTAKVSVAAVHRWGMTSFTSLRKAHINGQKDIVPDIEPVKRLKLEPTNNPSYGEDPFSFESDIEIPSHNQTSVHHTSSKSYSGSGFGISPKPVVPKPNKFFKSSGRVLVSGPNSRKNDFDALRLSISTNCSTLKSESDACHLIGSRRSTSHSDPQLLENSSILFESAIPSEPVHLKFLSNDPITCTSACFSKNDSHYSNPICISDEMSSCPSNLFADGLRTDQCPQNKFLNINSASHLQLPIHFSEEKIELSSNVMHTPTCRTYEDGNFFSNASWDGGEIDCTNQTTQIANVENSRKESHNNDIQLDVVAIKSECGSYAQALKAVPSSLHCTNALQNDVLDIEEAKLHSLSSIPQHIAEERNVDIKHLSRPKKIFSTTKKPKAVYNHRHWQATKELEQDIEKVDSEKEQNVLESEYEENLTNDEVMQNLLYTQSVQAESSGETINSIKCARPAKQFYTVVRNVKQAYQCHESGETQEFNDDIEYLLEGVQDCNGVGTRCLSVLSLATKCMGPAFRIHLRAHGTMPKIFSALQDAPSDPNLSLCTATLMFVLSQDRLTMDIEASTLSMMLQLLETDPEVGSPEKEIDLILEDPALCAMQEKHREKVYQLCEQMQQKGHAKHLKLDNINAGILAMETLLSLTSRKAGEWFKEEIRNLHGLDHIVDTITSCVMLLIPEENEVISHPSESQMDKIRKIDRCLRVLENVTYMNFENQDYLIHYKDSLLITSCLSLMRLCKLNMLANKQLHFDVLTEETSEKMCDSPILYCLLSLMKVLLNITHENPLGSSRVGTQHGLMELVLMCILQVPRTVPTEKRFDLLVLSLGLMINLVEHCVENRKQLMEMYVPGSFDTMNDGYELPASEALVEVLLSRLEAARRSEEQADALLSSQEKSHAASIERKDPDNAATQAERLEETLMKTLQKAGKHMEHSVIAAYISLLLGCTIQNNEDHIDSLRDHVPEGKFDVMVDVLKKFMSFVSLTGAVGNTGVKSIQRIIEVLESS